MNDTLSIIPLGGAGDVTKNMYVYEYKDEIFIVDCGLGFADETMLGVDLLLPDVSYILDQVSKGKRIVGMAISHGHEDHMGALPYLLPQLPEGFPIYASPLTAAMANNKLTEYTLGNRITPVEFDAPEQQVGSFSLSFIRVTHSVPDTAHIFIKTPVGNIYHGSDFKFDRTPYDGKETEFEKIKSLSSQGVLCLLSDCLGVEREGVNKSESELTPHFREALRTCSGKLVVTTYSSNIARINQVLDIAKEFNRKVCFVGKSLIKTKDVAQKLGYIKIPQGFEVEIEELKRYKDSEMVLIVAGTQGQGNSALSRIANSEHREISLNAEDLVIFSSDPIPGNEVAVYGVIDQLAKQEVAALYSPATRDFHVSGHGAAGELGELIDLVKPQFMLPIGGSFRHMFGYRKMAMKKGYGKEKILLWEDGHEVILSPGQARFGRTIPVKAVYVDEVGDEVEQFVLRDRQKLSEGGIVIIMAEVDSNTGQLVAPPDVIMRGFPAPADKRLVSKINSEISKTLGFRRGRVVNWVHIRKTVGEVAEKAIFRTLRRRPLVLPVVLEV